MIASNVNEKKFICDACEKESDPLTRLAHVPENWIRLQSKAANPYGSSWVTVAYICDICSGIFDRQAFLDMVARRPHVVTELSESIVESLRFVSEATLTVMQALEERGMQSDLSALYESLECLKSGCDAWLIDMTGSTRTQ